jgi:hypothetical protein
MWIVVFWVVTACSLHGSDERLEETKITVLWGIAPCSMVEFYWRFSGTCNLHRLWNVCKHLPYYTAQHTRRQSSSYSPPWEPEISSIGRNIYSEDGGSAHIHKSVMLLTGVFFITRYYFCNLILSEKSLHHVIPDISVRRRVELN